MCKQYVGIITVILLLLCQAQIIRAQTETPKVEVGIHFSLLRLSEFEDTTPGVGGRITFNPTKRLGLEAEFTHYPNHIIGSRSRMLGLFGLKAGQRFDKLGIFAKARPGFIYLFDAQVRCLPGITSPQACIFDDRIKFALDLGGVVELYPSRRTVIRFDVGDALIRFDRARLTPVPAFRAEVTHNLQLNVGVGLRF